MLTHWTIFTCFESYSTPNQNYATARVVRAARADHPDGDVGGGGDAQGEWVLSFLSMFSSFLKDRLIKLFSTFFEPW